MKSARLMVVLVLSFGCAATQPLQPSVAAESKLVEVTPASAFYSDPGTSIAGQQYCWIYEATPTYLQPLPGWHECEGRKRLVWERHDRQTEEWIPEEP